MARILCQDPRQARPARPNQTHAAAHPNAAARSPPRACRLASKTAKNFTNDFAWRSISGRSTQGKASRRRSAEAAPAPAGRVQKCSPTPADGWRFTGASSASGFRLPGDTDMRLLQHGHCLERL